MKKLDLAALALLAAAFSAPALAAPAPVPEPGTLGLLAAGIAGIVAVRLLKRK